MSGEAYRWTAKTPSELYHTLGPHGVDHLVRQMLDVCWRESPDEGRSLAGVKRAAGRVFDRNISVWARIKQPSPAAFFENLLPNAADGFMRQEDAQSLIAEANASSIGKLGATITP